MLLNLRSACVDTCIDIARIKHEAMKLSVWSELDMYVEISNMTMYNVEVWQKRFINRYENEIN